MENCPKCGAARPEGAAECPRCGVIYARMEAAAAKKRAAEEAERQAAQEKKVEPPPGQQNIMDCPACGKPVSVAAASCPHCGHPVPNQPPKLTKFDVWVNGFILVVTIGFFLFVAGGLIYCSHKFAEFQSGGGSSVSSGAITIRANTVGCRSVEDFRALADMAAQRDYAAFERRMKAHVATQTCKELPSGATAYREGYNGTHGADKIRIDGESGTWWINAQ